MYHSLHSVALMVISRSVHQVLFLHLVTVFCCQGVGGVFPGLMQLTVVPVLCGIVGIQSSKGSVDCISALQHLR